MNQNKTSKYFKYAIGEIILVMIGILLALQVNNWNEERKQNKAEKIILTNLYDDLTTDSIQFAYYNEQYQQIETLHFQLYRIGINNEDLDTLAEPALIRRTLYFKQLINKDLNKEDYPIVNSKIRKDLVSYTKSMSDFEQVYLNELRPVIADKLKPYLSSQNLYNTKNWFELKKRTFEDYSFASANGKNLIDKEGLIKLSKTKEFQQILFELNVKWNDFYSRLSTVIKENNNLRTLIQLELKTYK
jgi:hypothetical protein